MIFYKWTLACVALVGCVCASPASAAILVQDNFDSYANQAAFVAAWPMVGALPSGTLTSTQSVSAPNSINYSTVAQRNERSFTESGLPDIGTGNIVRFSFDFFDSNAALAPYRQHANLQDGTAPGSGGQLVSLGLNNNLTLTAEGGNFYMARILGANSNGGTAGQYFKLNDAGAPLRSTGWHNLAVEISNVDFKFFVDGILAETTPQSAATPLRSYDVVRLGSGLTSTAEAFFDNVSVQTIPEPSTLALLAVAGMGLFLLRRRCK